MLGIVGFLRQDDARTRLLALAAAIAAVLALAASGAAPARASGCENSWVKTESGSWFTAGNWSKKAVPAAGEEVCIAEPGTYTVEANGTSSISLKSLTVGAASGTQTLQVASTCSVNADLATSAGITVGAHGALTMTNGDGCGNNVTLEGPIANAGTISSELDHGGNRTIAGSVTNTGAVAVNQNTTLDASGSVLTDEGSLTVAEGKQLTANNSASITNATGGKILGTGTGVVFVDSAGSTFTQGAGTISGSQPVVVQDSSLAYTGTGSGPIAVRGSTKLSGSLSSGQALTVQSTCSENAVLTAASGFTNGGSIVLSNGDGCGDNVTLAVTEGTLSNTGTITTEVDHGGSRTIAGSVKNKGTLAIDQNTAFNAKSATLTNEGAVSVAEGIALSFSNATTLTNASGGSIAGSSSGVVAMGSGTSFTEGAGTTSGTQPVILDDASLTYSGAGASAIGVRGTSALAGASSAGQSLAIQSTCSENALLTAATGFTNGGSITMTNGDGCANNETLAITEGTLTNSGTITTEVDHGGSRTVAGNVKNTGTLAIDQNTSFNGKAAALTNEDTIDVAEGIALTASNSASVTNGTGGKIVATGSGDVVMSSGTTFTQGAGTISGTQPVVLEDAALLYTGSGAGSIAVRGTSTLGGNVSAGQSIEIQSTCGKNALLTAATGFTNGGSITLTNGDGCANNETLAITEGTLTNSGTITTEVDHGGSRTIAGNVKDTGTLTVNQNTAFDKAGALLTNEGTVALATGVALSVNTGASVANEAGTIAATGSGTLSQSGGTFTEGNGKTSGSQPVTLDDLALHYTGKGASTIALRGTSTLSGAINAGQSLAIQSTCGENASVNAGGSLSNGGTVALTNGDGCGNNETLSLAGGTLENTGVLDAETAHGGGRTIEGSIVNEKTAEVGAGETLHVTGTFTSTAKKAVFKTAIASASSYGTLAVGGAATLGGTLTLSPTKGLVPALGSKLAILTTSTRSGVFAKVKGAKIKIKKGPAGVFYDPVYSSGGVTLLVTQAVLAVTPGEGAPGSTVKLSGSDLPGEDKIKLTFTDAKKAKTTYATVTTNIAGEFSVEETVPAAAAEGTGTFTESSTATGAAQSTTFKVT